MNEEDKWLMDWNYTPLGREMKNLMEKLDKEEEDLAAVRDYLLGARPMLSVEQDLELVKQGVKTRKPVQYGKKVVVKK